MEWLPEWAARMYSRLYYKFGSAPFSFADFRDVTNSDKPRAGRSIQELEASAFLYRARSEADLRKKRYYLVAPDQAISAFALSQDASTVEDKLRSASKRAASVVTGSAAAYQYHGYMTPAKTDVLIFQEDRGFWYALFKEKGVEVAIDRILPEREGKIVHLHTALTDEILSRAQEIDGIFYTSREDLVLELIRDPSDRSVLEALAILVRSSKELDWDLLARSDVRQELGFLMELFNRESAGERFPESVITSFAEREGVLKPLSTSDRAVDVPESHNVIADRWNLQLNLPPTVIRKAVEDLAG